MWMARYGSDVDGGIADGVYGLKLMVLMRLLMVLVAQLVVDCVG